MDAANEPLTEAHWQQIEHLFLEAVARPPEKRAAFLATACAGDPVLNEEVAAMLAAHEEAGDDYLEALDPDCAAALLQKPDTEPAEVIGPYRLVEELGRGGMGTVYLAERADGQFEQRVALKLIKRGMDSEAVLQRFLAERQILARLQHPNVARLLDGGITDDGRPYFAMEHVAGRPITQYCDEGRLSVEARLRLFAGVCQAVQYAHRNLIVHRDLKPSNILVTDDGQVKLLDFGIGKVLGGETDAQPPTLTEAGLRAMTPEYAAPEQVRGEAVTTATDVYSLGVVLYELLAGRRPYAFVRRTPDAVARVLFDTEPERPSTAISRTGEAAKVFWDTEETICRRRATTAAALRRRLAGDLDTVVLKALRKEPDRRYASAEAFVEDIKRHLAGLPVTARKDTWSYRAKKFVQRNRVGVAVGGGLVILLVAFLRIYTHAITEEKSAAQHAARRASLMAGVMQDLLEGADPYAWGAQRGDSLFLTLGQQKVMTDLAGEPDLQVRLLTTLGTVHRRRGQYNEARRVLDQALAIARTTYDAPHPSLTQVLNEMGYYYSAIGAYAQAEPFYREALALQRQVFGEDHPEVLQSMTTLAQLRWLEGYTAEAETMLREIVALGREAHGTSDPAYLPSLWKLARVLFIRGKFGESEQRFLEGNDIEKGTSPALRGVTLVVIKRD